MQLVNSRKDLDNLPAEERDRFLKRLAAGVQRWKWIDGEYQLVEDTSGLERIGLTLDDVTLPDPPPEPEMTPDEKEKEDRKAEIKEALDSIDARYHTDRGVREHILDNPDQYADGAVDRAKAAEEKASSLRDELAELTT